MNILGIVAEYNPFHNGHLWHLEKAKQLSGSNATIAVMSGNFMQRGEPALFDKWIRASLAVKSGIDLVIELPIAFSVRSADYFAAGSIRLLDRLNIVTHVAFGAETPDLNLLSQTASLIDDPVVLSAMHSYLTKGYQYAAAFRLALGCQGVSNNLLNNPNNILAVQYLRSITNYKANMLPIAIKREQTNYHDTTIKSSIASATAIRDCLLNNQEIGRALQTLPVQIQTHLSQMIEEGYGPVHFQAYESIILANLRKFSDNDWQSVPDLSEGLDFKLRKVVQKATSLQEIVSYTKSKRYPTTRIKRILIHALLGTDGTDIKQFDETGPLYARILAFNDIGRNILKMAKETSLIPIITKSAEFLTSKKRGGKNLTLLEKMFALDTYATDIYSLGIPNQCFRRGCRDFTVSPHYLQTLH